MRTIGILLLFLIATVLERTFFAGLSGGVAAMNVAAVIVIVRMTMLSRRGLVLWITAAACAAELFSQSIFGAAALGILVGCATARIALLSLFSHRAFFPRTVCAAIGLVVGAFAEAGVRLTSGVVDPIDMALGRAATGALQIAGWDILLAAALLAAAALLRRTLGSVLKPLAT